MYSTLPVYKYCKTGLAVTSTWAKIGKLWDPNVASWNGPNPGLVECFAGDLMLTAKNNRSVFYTNKPIVNRIHEHLDPYEVI